MTAVAVWAMGAGRFPAPPRPAIVMLAGEYLQSIMPRTDYASPYRVLKPMRYPTTRTESLQYSDSGVPRRPSASARLPPSIIVPIEAAARWNAACAEINPPNSGSEARCTAPPRNHFPSSQASSFASVETSMTSFDEFWHAA